MQRLTRTDPPDKATPPRHAHRREGFGTRRGGEPGRTTACQPAPSTPSHAEVRKSPYTRWIPARHGRTRHVQLDLTNKSPLKTQSRASLSPTQSRSRASRYVYVIITSTRPRVCCVCVRFSVGLSFDKVFRALEPIGRTVWDRTFGDPEPLERSGLRNYVRRAAWP